MFFKRHTLHRNVTCHRLQVAVNEYLGELRIGVQEYILTKNAVAWPWPGGGGVIPLWPNRGVQSV